MYPKQRTQLFVQELQAIWPHAEYHTRKGLELKKVVQYATNAGFSDVIVITEQKKNPYHLILCHLPKGPTATFRISSFKAAKEIKGAAERSTHAPELFLKNFDTRLGRRIGRMLRATFRLEPKLAGRSIATFHNQRDFIFFRMHRYIFDSLQKVRIQELGPQFTLRLKGLQATPFDPKFGEWEWAFHKREMGGRDRRMFNL
eukprot:TRINITY_DN7710_c0_g1_i1.p1 TRINITY_DN7710_c0_g1~~TRINITY_DN7710_c0_g1_i1.p1  ORF type:complete len:201 (-),score=57.51 TRINITY_DN7710_c0_g1_i1:109-711(-)